jgi:Transposase domain (DUF772)
MYAYSQGNRSARGIERKCREDVAYRVIAANLVPDHSTIAEFRARHEVGLAGLFGDVLGLCREAGLVRVGVIAVDGTKVHANASNMANMDYRLIAEEILKDAARIDREEDELYGDKRGDELPLELSTHNGRREWLREAKRRLDEKREREARPVPRSRPKRLQEAKNVCRRSCGPSSTRTRLMRRGGRPGTAPMARGGWHRARSNRMCRRTCLRGR